MNWGNAWKEIKGVKVCREGWKQKVLLILLVFQIVQSVHSDCTKIWRFVLCETGSIHPPLPLSHPSYLPTALKSTLHTHWVFSLVQKSEGCTLCNWFSPCPISPPLLSYLPTTHEIKDILSVNLIRSVQSLCWKYH